MTIRNKSFSIGRLFEGDLGIWMILFFFCIISVLEVYSASSTMTFKQGHFWGPVLMHTIYLGVGVGITWIVHRIPCRYFGWIVIVGPILSVFLLILAIFTAKTNDGGRWLTIAGLSVQPSEIGKGSLIVLVAWLLSVMRDERGATVQAFKWIIGCSIVICGLIVSENLSTAAFTFAVVLIMMFIGGVPWKQLGTLVGILAVGGGLVFSVLKFTPEDTIQDLSEIPLLHRLPTWAHRVRDHVDYPQDPMKFDLTTNPQITQAQIAISTNNIIGRGPGNSKVRDALPQAYSDFIFAIILEELGLLGGFFVMALYVALLYRAARIAGRCEKNFPAYLIMGLALLIVSQAFINMMVAVGMFPVTGQPLPLISRGGSSLLVNCAYIGMMLSISRSARQVQEPVKKDA